MIKRGFGPLWKREKFTLICQQTKYIDSVKDYEAAGASVMLLNTAGSVPSLLEMASISDSEASFLFFLQAKDDAKDTAESLKKCLWLWKYLRCSSYLYRR